MKLYHRIGIFFLFAVLLLCTACSPAIEVTPTPAPESTLEPTPEPTPAPTPEPPPWEVNPRQFILDNLNAAFSNGRLNVRVFSSHGSGPASTAVLDSECGQEVRELFSSYDWEVTQRPLSEDIPYLSFGVDFHDLDAPYNIGIDTYSDALSMFPFDDSMDTLYFRADGAENLIWDIVSLCPDPRAQCALVRCPVQETREGTARLFMDDFFSVMLENGHITDYELVRLDMLREDPDYPSMITFNVRFRLKAAHPEWAFWTDAWLHYISVDESGWTNTIEWKVYLVTDDVAGGDGEVYVIDWIS